MPQSASPAIRRATAADAAMLAEFGAATFYETFAEHNTAEDMAAYLRDSFTTERVASELADPQATFLIAEIAGAPAGYAKLLDCPALPCVSGPAPLELVRLYVATAAIGSGVGAALMRACIRHALDTGAQTLWLGVWDQNRRARAFYEKWGFVEVGEHAFQLGADIQNDLIVQKILGEADRIGAREEK